MRTERAVIRAGSWRGFPAVTSASGDLAITVVPALGAKIASLRWRGTEWLLQPSANFDWDARSCQYEDAELCGWDEMYPTIVGDGLPDHGELWSRVWEVKTSGDVITTSIHSHHGPSRFRRAIHVFGPNSLALHYAVTSCSLSPVHFLWAAHPQFLIDADTEVELVGHTLRPVSGAAVGSVSGPLLVSGALPAGTAGKWWSEPGAAEPTARLRTGAGQLELTCRSASVPIGAACFGVWLDRSAVAAQDAISLQPAFGHRDDLNLAVANGTAARLAPHATVSWSLKIAFTA